MICYGHGDRNGAIAALKTRAPHEHARNRRAATLAWPCRNGPGESADVRGFSGAYEQLLPEFERTSGIKVTTGRAHRRDRGRRRSARSSQAALQPTS